MLKAAESLSLEQICTIPTGFNNSILWNLGHVLVTQQLLVYKLADMPLFVEQDLVDRYRKGTSPDHRNNAEDWYYIKDNLVPIAELMRHDLKQQVFKTYTTYETSFGITLKDAFEASLFNNLHESMHLGCIQSLKKFV
ncbi:MAG: hypothetical protein ACJAZM_000760 [Cyclobacteriaceae bacterium]|jgi:hypothetical protein